MDGRTVVAFLVGAVLTAAAFLLFGADDTGLVDPAPVEDGRTSDTVDRTEPMLEGSGSATLDALTPTDEETEWIKGALETERERRAAATIREGDTGLEIMRRIFRLDADPTPLFESYAKFRSPIVESEEAPLQIAEPRGGETISFKDDGVDRVLIELGPGVFPIAENDQFWRPVYSKGTSATHVVIRGAGLDQTTLIAGHQWALLLVAGVVEHLVIRDLTLQGGEAEGALLDLRGEAAVALENVRVSGWQVSGHAAAIGISGNAYLGCKGCTFIGRGTGGGHAISLRGRSLVICEDCVFEHLGQGAIIGSSDATAGGAVVLRDCTFESSLLTDREPKFPIRVIGGLVRYGPDDLSDDERRSKWGAERAERLEGVTFEAVPPVCTLGSLLDVLEKVDLPDGEQIVIIELDGVIEGKPTKFRVHTLPPTGRQTKTYLADVTRGWPEMTHLERAGGQGLPPVDVVRRAKSFLEVLKGSAVPLDIGVSELHYQWQGGDPSIPTVAIATPQGWNSWYFNAETGELLHQPK